MSLTLNQRPLGCRMTLSASWSHLHVVTCPELWQEQEMPSSKGPHGEQAPWSVTWAVGGPHRGGGHQGGLGFWPSKMYNFPFWMEEISPQEFHYRD